MQSTQWYVAVDDQTVGPVSTGLVIRGIENGKVPTTAYVCPVGEEEWQAIAQVPQFHETVRRSSAPPPGVSELSQPHVGAEANLVSDSGPFREAADTLPLPRDVWAAPTPIASPFPFSPPAGEAPSAGPSVNSAPAEGDRVSSSLGERRSSEFEITLDQPEPEAPSTTLSFSHPIVGYFSNVDGLVLPDERLLLDVLQKTPQVVLLEQDALWNVALCLSFGKEPLRGVVARRFFETVTAFPQRDGLTWMVMTLESKGFLPSGIPREAGLRGLAALENHCPAHLEAALAAALGN